MSAKVIQFRQQRVVPNQATVKLMVASILAEIQAPGVVTKDCDPRSGLNAHARRELETLAAMIAAKVEKRKR